jgi:hypothetical protein
VCGTSPAASARSIAALLSNCGYAGTCQCLGDGRKHQLRHPGSGGRTDDRVALEQFGVQAGLKRGGNREHRSGGLHRGRERPAVGELSDGELSAGGAEPWVLRGRGPARGPAARRGAEPLRQRLPVPRLCPEPGPGRGRVCGRLCHWLVDQVLEACRYLLRGHLSPGTERAGCPASSVPHAGQGTCRSGRAPVTAGIRL